MLKQLDSNHRPPTHVGLWLVMVRCAFAALACTVLVEAKAVEPTTASRSLDFTSTFSASGEPADLHYDVIFMALAGTHTLEVWRDAQTRLRRKTDNAVDTYVVRNPADPSEYQMTVVDYRKRITTFIDRNNLVRLGHFSDWFDLAHGIRYPTGKYRLVQSNAPRGAPKPIDTCRWYAVEQTEDEHRICWNTRERLPLIIWSQRRGIVWRVTQITHEPITADIFKLHDAGFVRNNANSDIDSD